MITDVKEYFQDYWNYLDIVRNVTSHRLDSSRAVRGIFPLLHLVCCLDKPLERHYGVPAL